MVLRTLIPLLCVGVLCSGLLRAEQPAAPPVYEQQLKDGSTLYTDQPSAAAKVQQQGGVLGFVSGGGNAPSNVVLPNSKAEPDIVEEKDVEVKLEVATTSYSTLRIEKPAHNSAVWAEQPLVSVVVDIQPLLNPEHALQLRIDPNAWQTIEHKNGVAELPLERGSHRMQARVVDANGGLVRLSAPVKFTVHRASALQ